MAFVTVDGDDIGRRLAACYLSNDVEALVSTKSLVELKTHQISQLLTETGFEVLFCAADGVTAYSQQRDLNESVLYQSIKDIVGDELAFSMGIGAALREAYVALLYAKSTGKARSCSFNSMGRKCFE